METVVSPVFEFKIVHCLFSSEKKIFHWDVLHSLFYC